MKPIRIITILLLAAQWSYAQIKFEPGYFISPDGNRTECEIRNVDWENNPTSFQYRLVGGEQQDGTIENVVEFGFTGGATFLRFAVDLDRSTDVTDKLSKDRNPSFKEEILFLRLLTSGKATLYEYVDSGLRRFFYAMDGESTPKQLVYKRYMQRSSNGSYETGFAAENVQFKQQVNTDLKCASISQKDAENLKYERGSLMKIFTKYNECTGTAVGTGEPEVRKSTTHFAVRPGLFYNIFYFGNSVTRTEFEPAMSFRLGLEVEVVMPFNKGMWSATLEPSYQGYSSKFPGSSYTIDYKAIDLNFGVRRYVFIKESGSLYINAGFVYSIPLSGEGALQSNLNSFDISSSYNLSAGIGYRLKKFSAEFNYAFNRGLLGDYISFQSGYGGPGLILGYQLK